MLTAVAVGGAGPPWQEVLDMSFAEADDDAVTALAAALDNKLNLRQLELNGNKFHPPTETGRCVPP